MLWFKGRLRLGKESLLSGAVAAGVMVCLLCGGLWGAEDLPANFRAAQDAMTKPSDNTGYILSLVLLLIVVLVVWRAIVFRRNHKTPYLPAVNDPQKLFEDLLKQLQLEPSEQKLLRQMVRGARLKHPTMCLLSPQMLAWACKLWHSEKGINEVPAEIAEQLDGISCKLFEQPTGLIDSLGQQMIDWQNSPELVVVEPKTAGAEVASGVNLNTELENAGEVAENVKPLMVQPVLEDIF
ncbi:MAG: hypothetical protein JW936_07695 [Sedimentisphaerales bacterium]|nr:hypothetical protein [Sedimentisphaerales bacterium]